MKELFKKTACVQDPLNDFKKRIKVENDNEALFIAVILADTILKDEELMKHTERFKKELKTENIKITRR